MWGSMKAMWDVTMTSDASGSWGCGAFVDRGMVSPAVAVVMGCCSYHGDGICSHCCGSDSVGQAMG